MLLDGDTYWDVTIDEVNTGQESDTGPEASTDTGGGAAQRRDASGGRQGQSPGQSPGQSVRRDRYPQCNAHFVVSSVEYAATHRVTAEQIRPLWIWTGAPDGQGSPSWKYELMAGRGVVEEGAAGGSGLQAVFQYTESLARRHSNYFHSLRHSALALGQDSSA